MSIDRTIERIADKLRESVESIEAEPATTKGHYGTYMSLINTLTPGGHVQAEVVSLALLKAGANREGVAAAYRIITGKELP